ncbi:MAG: NAD kinase [Micrococcaceae bacterium]
MARKILILGHMGRVEAQRASLLVIKKLTEAHIVPLMLESELADLKKCTTEDLSSVEIFDGNAKPLELIIVLGGDGTILRAAELGKADEIPVLGVNLGHVGFLAESEKEDLSATTDAVVSKEYAIEDRMCLDVNVYDGKKLKYSDWALNEAAIEKRSNARMIELAIEVGNEPLVSYGCDGLVMSTPTGSTAYAFSAGGPVMWPDVEAVMMVPLSAHTLFAKPLVIGPRTQFSVEMLKRNEGTSLIWCDGRRTFELLPGYRVEVNVSPTKVHLAHLKLAPFTNRLVRKFKLPVDGLRGPDEES